MNFAGTRCLRYTGSSSFKRPPLYALVTIVSGVVFITLTTDRPICFP